jgi:predicted transposase/invertase (TIGR01784 family)
MDNMAVMDQKLYEAEMRGEARGEARGIEKGIEKGKIEAQLEIAKNLLQNGMEINFVTQFTGLSGDQIHMLSSSDTYAI